MIPAANTEVPQSALATERSPRSSRKASALVVGSLLAASGMIGSTKLMMDATPATHEPAVVVEPGQGTPETIIGTDEQGQKIVALLPEHSSQPVVAEPQVPVSGSTPRPH